MSDVHTFGPWLRRFLSEFIVTERNLARNTQKSYRDTFILLLPFADLRTPARRLAWWLVPTGWAKSLRSEGHADRLELKIVVSHGGCAIP